MITFLQTIIKTVYLFLLPKFIKNCNPTAAWRTEQQIQRDAWGSVHTARVAQHCSGVTKGAEGQLPPGAADGGAKTALLEIF